MLDTIINAIPGRRRGSASDSRAGSLPLRPVGPAAGSFDVRSRLRHRQRASAARHDARWSHVRARSVHVGRPRAVVGARLLRRGGSRGQAGNLDEDNTASQYTDHFGWTIHRKRAWVAVMSGCHYDMIEIFTIRPGLSIGSPAAERDLRVWTWFLGYACEHWELAASSSTDDVHLLDGDLAVAACRIRDFGRAGGWSTSLIRRKALDDGPRRARCAAYFGFRAVSALCVPSPQPPAGRWVRRP